MTTCRDVLSDAFSALGVIAFGCEPTADEIDGGLSAMSRVILDLHAARGPLSELDVRADYLASENQRLRIAAGAHVVVTLPNSIVRAAAPAISDYRFLIQQSECTTAGSAAAADGVLSHPPQDGARIEIVGLTQALYFYRSDLNAWIAVSPLVIDGPTPINASYSGALAALVAERLCDPMCVTPSAALAKRISRGNAAFMLNCATSRRGPRAIYL